MSTAAPTAYAQVRDGDPPAGVDGAAVPTVPQDRRSAHWRAAVMSPVDVFLAGILATAVVAGSVGVGLASALAPALDAPQARSAGTPSA